MSSELSREELEAHRDYIAAVMRERTNAAVAESLGILHSMAESWRAHCEAGRVPPYSPEYLLEVAENTLIPVDPKKKAALFAVTDTFSKPDGYVRPPQVKLSAGDSATQSAESEAGRVSVPNDAASYPRDNALEVARSMEIAVIAWKAAHGNETLKHPDQSLLARSFLAVASELTWRDQLSAAPAPAAQVKHDDASSTRKEE